MKINLVKQKKKQLRQKVHMSHFNTENKKKP